MSRPKLIDPSVDTAKSNKKAIKRSNNTIWATLSTEINFLLWIISQMKIATGLHL